jgi:anaerobic selenocysteine-containing dehydrogenase
LRYCGIDVHVKRGRLIRVTPNKKHPFNKICIKAQAWLEHLYLKERITHPCKRVNGGWDQISWNEALDIIVNKLNNIKETYGAKALAVAAAAPSAHLHSRVASRFCSLYGTPNYSGGSSYCLGSKVIGQGLTLSKHALSLYSDYEDTRCVVVWGMNPQSSDLSEAMKILSAKKRGAKLIVIDPRKTSIAKKADIYVPIRPGTDCALALGFLNVIVSEELYDKDFVENWTIGFDKLKEHVKTYSLERIEEITWVPAETIRKMAIMYATNKPAAITQGIAVEHCVSGVQTSRAISILIAITGNIDIAGGNVYSPLLRLKSFRVKGMGSSLSEAVGAKYPLFGRFLGEDQALAVIDAILEERPYSIKALIIQGGNPLISWPNNNKVKKAFEKIDFLVVVDYFMTETAKLANILLPVAAPMEQDWARDYNYYGAPLLYLGRKAVDPPGECLADWKVWAELGKKMGFGEYFPWQTAEELYDELLGQTNITTIQLKGDPGGIWYRDPNERQHYLKEGFETPSGKVEIFSQTMKDYGYDPLPIFIEPAESPISKPELANKYPYILVTGSRIVTFLNSQHRNIVRLKKLSPEPLVAINTYLAKERGIANGDTVVIESPRGSIKMKAEVSDDVHPKVVIVPIGWAIANANILTDDENVDPITGYPGLRTLMCQVTKANL